MASPKQPSSSLFEGSCYHTNILHLSCSCRSLLLDSSFEGIIAAPLTIVCTSEIPTASHEVIAAAFNLRFLLASSRVSIASQYGCPTEEDCEGDGASHGRTVSAHSDQLRL